MNKILSFLACSILVTRSFAQLSPIPPPSTVDGVVVVPKSAGNSGVTHWDAAPGLASYKLASDGNPSDYLPGTPDNVLGLNWSTSINPSISSAMAQLNLTGGLIRAIFVGETSPWLNDFGYTYTGNPAGIGSFTLFQNIQAVSPGATIAFGDNVLIGLTAGQTSTFDFWLNAVGDNPAPAPPTTAGGVYTILNPSNGTPYVAPGAAKFAQDPLVVNTAKLDLSGFENVDTFLVGVEDVRLDRGSDNDYNDFVFGLQFYKADGTQLFKAAETPTPPQSAPEGSSTFGLLFGGVLLVLIGATKRFAPAASFGR